MSEVLRWHDHRGAIAVADTQSESVLLVVESNNQKPDTETVQATPAPAPVVLTHRADNLSGIVPREPTLLKTTPTTALKEATGRLIKSLEPLGRSGKVGFVAPRTLWDYRQMSRILCNALGDKLLQEIDPDAIRAYQEMRAATCAPPRINKEVTFLIRIMKRAGAWTAEHVAEFQWLKVEAPEVPRAMTIAQQNRFLSVAKSNPSYQVIYLYWKMAIEMCFSNCEMRGLHIGDIDLFNRTVTIGSHHAKNKYRVRTNRIRTDSAYRAAEMLLDRARGLGAVDYDHFLFPFRVVRGQYDPTKPMCGGGGLRKAFEELRKEAGVPWLRWHDTRHTGNTRLAEAGASVHELLAIAGHMSPKLMVHYTHLSQGRLDQVADRAFTNGSSQIKPAGASEPESEPISAKEDLPSVVRVNSEPAGADIEVDGAFVGSTPSDLCLPSGMREIKITRAGYEPYCRKLAVTASGKLSLMASLSQIGSQHANH